MIAYPRIIAHRCGGALAPENSLAGLEAVARLGCRAVEFDVMLSHDGVPVLIHDETLERTIGCAGRVAETSFAALRAIAPGVPTLAEAIAACERLSLWANIEIKPAAGHEVDTGDVVGAWLAQHWRGEGIISSFSEKSALAARRHLPQAPFALLCEGLPADWTDALRRLGALAVHLDATRVDAAVAQALATVPWAAWTVNDVATATRLFDLGCAAIFTDRPDLWPAKSA